MADRELTDRNGDAESPDAAAFGNRPAAGAHLADHAASLPSTFGGGQEATDFLGLSHELGAVEAGPAEPDAASRPPTSTESFANDASPSWLLSEQGTPARTGDEDEATEAPEAETADESKRPQRLLSLAAAVLVIGAAVTVAMRFSRHEATTQKAPLANGPSAPARPPSEKPDELATSPGQKPHGRERLLPGGESVPVETNETPAPESNPSNPVPSVAEAPEPIPSPNPAIEPTRSAPAEPEPPARIGAKRLSEWMARSGWRSTSPTPDSDIGAFVPGVPSTPLSWATMAYLAFASSSRVGMPSAESVSTAPDAGSETPTIVYTEIAPDAAPPTAATSSKAPARVPFANLRFASKEDLASLWSSTAIPMEEVDGPTRILTPSVGLVRVVLKTGEIFDGRLYAVGQGQVWIETDIGRLALGAKRVQKIDVVVSDKETRVVDALPRMRVRTPGGLFFGKVLARDDSHVTLLLEGGGRITLESSDVEPAPLGDTRVVGPVKL